MSIEIYYGRNFIKVDDKRFIPLHLHGSSNCTEFVGGREVYERRWGYYPFDFITTVDELNKKLDSFEDPYGEWFARGSRNGPWISKEQFRNICHRAIKDAHTVEEFAESYHPVRLCAWKYSNSEWTKKMDRYVRTTQELLDWYDEYNNTLKDDNFSISCDLMTREQINITPKTANKFPCVAKCSWGYLTDSIDLGNTWCKDISKAHIFNSQDEIDAVRLRGNGKISFVSANKKTVEKPYVLLVTDGARKGLYIKKRSSRSIFFSLHKDGAMRFSSEKQAEAYKEKIHCGAILGMKVVKAN